MISQLKMTIAFLLIAFLSAGCSNSAQTLARGAAEKNLDMNGYVMLAEAEAANPENGTPQGRLIIGNLTYKSRKVGIPADQKIPDTGSFRAVSRSTLLGTEETVVEYDFSASSTQAAQATLQIMTQQISTIEKILPKTTENN